MRGVAAVFAAILAVALAGCASGPPGECKLARVAELPLHRLGRHVLVDGKINGQPVTLVFDTGSFTSIITPEAAERLHLSMLQAMVGEAHGIGGSSTLSLMTARTLELGDAHGRNFTFTSGRVGVIGENFRADGLLSSDLFSKWDIDLDFRAKRIALFLPVGDCSRPAAFLTGPLYEVPLLPFENDKRPMVRVTIGGKQFTALIDTGAAQTTLFRHAAAQLGLHVGDLTSDRAVPLVGIGPRVVHSVLHVIEPVEIGDLTVKNMPVDLVDEASGDRTDMLLGADFQARVHLWISYSSRTLIMQYPALPSPPIPR
jgi:predicted aspartyl protease